MPETFGRVVVDRGEEAADDLLELAEGRRPEQDRLVGRDVVLDPASSRRCPAGGSPSSGTPRSRRRRRGCRRRTRAARRPPTCTPNSSENQKTSAIACSAASVSTRVGRLARGPLQRGEARRAEHVRVAHDLVDDVRLRRVERLGRVAHVLRRVEDALGERAVELAQPRRARAPGGRPSRSAAPGAR